MEVVESGREFAGWKPDRVTTESSEDGNRPTFSRSVKQR
jgi:hypothetical protein